MLFPVFVFDVQIVIPFRVSVNTQFLGFMVSKGPSQN